jgi:integrase
MSLPAPICLPFCSDCSLQRFEKSESSHKRRAVPQLHPIMRAGLGNNVVKYGVHRAMKKLGIETAKGAHVGIHCFRHGVTSELLESGTPIHVVTRLMRHADSNVTLEHYAHIVGDAERVASEKFFQRIGKNTRPII